MLLACAAAGAGARAPAQVAPSEQPAKPLLLATSEGPFATFGDPAGSRSGWVVFHATTDDGREGIYASSGGAPAPVVQTGSPVDTRESTLHMQHFGHQPTVNDALTCAFTAQFAEGGSAVLVSEGVSGKCLVVADSTEAFREFGELAAVNASRQVVFRATVDPPNHPDRAGFDASKFSDPTLRDHPERIPPPSRFAFDGRKDDFHAGLFLDRVGDLVVIGTTEKGLLDVPDGFAFNDAGAVAFRASRRQKSWSLLIAQNGGPPLPLAETGPRFASFEQPSIDSRGRVAFLAHCVGGDAVVCRTLIGGGLPEVIASSADGFTAFGPDVAMDAGGSVAFVARRREGGEALFVARGPGDLQPVFSAGDLVQRRAVKHLRLGSRAFARADRIAVLAQLEPDVEAIVLLELSR